jgi:prepilin-type N-terminal cleavage/methylation domain-containing protein
MLKTFNNTILKKQNGFTLIEVLIAIVILAFISLYATRMIDESSTTKVKVTTEDRNFMQTLTAMNRIESDINEIYSPLFSSAKLNPQASNDPYQDTNQTFNGSFEGKTKNGMPIPQITSDDKSSITFLSLVNRRKIADSKESNFVWIKYSLKPTEDEDERKFGGNDLIRQTISVNPFQSNLNWSDVRQQVILSNIKNFEFQYYDERNKRFTTSLSDLNENKNILRSIKAVFTWVNHDNNELKFEKVFRVLTPYFNTKIDELKTNDGAWGGSNPPPGMPTPPNGGQDGQHF